jgi:cytochrome c peroxidase
MVRLRLLAALVIPLGLDLYLPVPEENPLTVEKIELGRRLFNDRRLSRDESIACASCHNPDRAFSDGRAVPVGVFGREGRRNAPALINRGYGRAFFWDGRARTRTLEEQVLKPIQDPNEMDLTLDEASSRVGLDAATMSRALASYVRSILSGDSPYDRLTNGDRAALSSGQQAGLQIFRGKGNCTACHVGPNFTDERLHNTGVAWRDHSTLRPAQGRPEPSRGTKSSGQAGGYFADEGAGNGTFKTPTLREVAHTAPYMHDGSMPTLEEVVDFYDKGGRSNPSIDPEVHLLQLSGEEKQVLVAFLKSLSGWIREGQQ